MSDPPTAMAMLFLSIILYQYNHHFKLNDNVTFTKVNVLIGSKKGVRKSINWPYKFIHQKANKEKSGFKNHEFTNKLMI